MLTRSSSAGRAVIRSLPPKDFRDPGELRESQPFGPDAGHHATLGKDPRRGWCVEAQAPEGVAHRLPPLSEPLVDHPEERGAIDLDRHGPGGESHRDRLDLGPWPEDVGRDPPNDFGAGPVRHPDADGTVRILSRLRRQAFAHLALDRHQVPGDPRPAVQHGQQQWYRDVVWEVRHHRPLAGRELGVPVHLGCIAYLQSNQRVGRQHLP
jgi:hypothetical protein